MVLLLLLLLPLACERVRVRVRWAAVGQRWTRRVGGPRHCLRGRWPARLLGWAAWPRVRTLVVLRMCVLRKRVPACNRARARTHACALLSRGPVLRLRRLRRPRRRVRLLALEWVRVLLLRRLCQWLWLLLVGVACGPGRTG